MECSLSIDIPIERLFSSGIVVQTVDTTFQAGKFKKAYITRMLAGPVEHTTGDIPLIRIIHTNK